MSTIKASILTPVADGDIEIRVTVVRQPSGQNFTISGITPEEADELSAELRRAANLARRIEDL